MDHKIFDNNFITDFQLAEQQFYQSYAKPNEDEI